MRSRDIEALVKALPEAERWPELASVFGRVGTAPRPDWELPLRACTAVGGDVEIALPVAAAVACLQVSIILVDDMLDEDPRGIHVEHGFGPASNLSFGFQSAAFRLLAQVGVTDGIRANLFNTLSRVALKTSAGQHLDVQNLQSEEDYWTVVEAKSTPFYGGALSLGALTGGCTPEMARQLYDLGVIIGEIIQIEDDLEDAMEKPANADWLQGRNNLLILYAKSTPHDYLDRFLELLSRASEPAALEEAQQILIGCGAVSYCAYLLVDHYRNARQLLDNISLFDRSPLLSILDDYSDSLKSFLSLSGVDLPDDLLALGID